MFLPVDTSSIPGTATINSASLKLYGTTISNASGLDIYVVQGAAAATSTLVDADFVNVGSVAWSSAIDGDSLATSVYNTFSLNASGTAALNTSGYTQFALVEKNDFDNSAPGASAATLFEFSMSEQAGTSQDPYLEVDYTAVASSSATTTVQYAPRFDNGGFRTYSYAVSGTSSAWVVQDKFGTTYTFGSATTSRLDNPTDGTQVYRWMLSEVRDANGNYARYTYAKDNGQVYPSAISYSGNGSTDGPFQVNFLRTSWSDIATSSKTAFAVVDKYRINEINATINGTWVHRYALGYGTGSNGRRSMLTSVTESGQQEDGSVSLTLPSTSFAYTASTSGWTIDNTNWHSRDSFVTSTYADNGVRLVDINGDGLLEEVVGRDSTLGGYLNQTTGWDSSINGNYGPPAAFVDGSPHQETGLRFADVNGDGLVDALLNTTVRFNNGFGFNAASSTWTLPVATNDGSGGDNGTRVVDINGDGLADLLNNFKHLGQHGQGLGN
jgi:hypothetical protein